MFEYKQNTELPFDYLVNKIELFLQEDACSDDKTSFSTTGENIVISAYLESQSNCIFAGRPIIEYILKDMNFLEILVNDGDQLSNGTMIAKFRGNARIILARERVMLNLLQKLCGIATQANKYVEKAKSYGVKILDTRKTTPGLRLFEKYAVTCGGGTNHRFNLSDGILIKDNHITAAGGIGAALAMTKKMNYGLPIEIEVDTLEQIYEALKIGVDGFLLDNMDREKTIQAVGIIRSSKNGNDIVIESSGGINLSNIDNYLDTGINAISIGTLTHSVMAADIHLEFEFGAKN